MNSSKIKYLLLGGAAIVALSIAYHYATNSALLKDEDMEEIINEIGELEFDEKGIINFDQFLKILKAGTILGKK